MKHFWLCTCLCGMLLIFLPLLLPPPPLPATPTTTLLIELWIRTNTHIRTNIPVKQNKIPKTTPTCLIFTNEEKSKKKCFVVYLDLNSMTNEFIWKFVTMFFVFFSHLYNNQKIKSMSRLHSTHLYLLIWSDTDFHSSMTIYALPNSLRVCWAEWVSMIQ